jgi:hypothetical protein
LTERWTLARAGGACEARHRKLAPGSLPRYRVFGNGTGRLKAGRQCCNPLALDFLTSSEFRINLFTSYYNTLLHRAPDTIGLVNWILSNLDADSVRLGIESSAEFFANG